MATSKLHHEVVNGFRLMERVGRGGVAEVYRAIALTDPNAQAAVKVLLPGNLEDRDRIRSLSAEYDMLADLEHPCLPRLIGEAEIRDLPAIIMQYFPGPTLYALHAQGKKIDGEVAFYALVKVVAYLHQERVVHNDLKLENVIVRPGGKLGLVDFGNARTVKGTSVITSMFRRKPKTVFGTPTYLAPELLEGGHPSLRSDVYALGVCAHILIAGRPPYDAASGSGRLRELAAKAKIPSLRERRPDVPRDLAAIVDTCLYKDRDLRHEDAIALRDLLKARRAAADVQVTEG